ncbi:hypothetical protein VTP01DRAFT_2794 [Rhizomucor pusillus]|uniref:uncharacterized protein n=1 Tax=Rhizomucor pusillus TaxID=4840 RepID=UPI003741EC55
MANVDAFESISEGCFLILPVKRRDSGGFTGKRKRSDRPDVKISRRRIQSSVATVDFEPLFQGQEPALCIEMRKAAFSQAWSKLEKIINDILSDMNRSAVDNIARFVENAANEVTVDGQSLITLPYHEVPTALVFAGINTSDHGLQFSQIAAKLLEPSSEAYPHRTNFVSLLQAKDCPNLKMMMKTMIEQFMMFDTQPGDKEANTDEQQNAAENDEGYQLGKTAKRASRLAPHDMQILEGWYRDVAKKYTQQPNLVIILQDLESFEAAVLQDFVTICSEYHKRIPIIFVFGIATSMDILHQSLTKATIGFLRVEKFWLEQSDVWFNRLLETIFIDSLDTLKFGARPYKFLLDHFYLYDFSMGKVTASLKYALMHHYYGNPLSIILPLLSSTEEDNSQQLAEWFKDDIFTEHHIAHLRMLPSFKRRVETLCEVDPEEALRLLRDDRYLVTKALPQALSELKRFLREFQYGVEILRTLQTHFSNLGMKKSKRMLLLEALQNMNGLMDSELIKRPAHFVRKVAIPSLIELTKKLHTIAESFADVSNDARDLIDDWHERLMALSEAKDDEMARMQRKEDQLAGLVLPDMEKRSLRQTRTAQKVQMSSVDHLRTVGSERTKIPVEISDWILKILNETLRSYTTNFMYELVYYTSSRLHEKSFAAQPRAAVQTALSQSHHYLNCDCCAGENKDQILPSEHDTCILYKLYLECGRMINMYDWFVAFGCILERDKSRKLKEKEVQARFVRSVAELQYLGFIKPTQRKTDHVIRLTWSNV